MAKQLVKRKASREDSTANRRQSDTRHVDDAVHYGDRYGDIDMPVHYRREKIKALTPTQARYIASIESKVITFGVGIAGSGKTFISAGLAAQALLDGKTQKIIVTRPTVEVGETLGFLPGSVAEKFEPYIAPVRDVLQHILGPGHLGYALRHNKIVPVPLSLMRGMSLDDSWILLDEAQNSTPAQMKMFLTRIGKNTKVIVNGDLGQSDLPKDTLSGLEDAIMRFGHYPEMGLVEFGEEDCVRSGIVRRILEGYR